MTTDWNHDIGGERKMAPDSLPPVVQELASKYPDVWDAYGRLGDAVSEAGPLDVKTERLVKLALAIGAGREGAVHSHARRAARAGWSTDELRQVALLAITTLGWSGAVAAYCWINDVVGAAPPHENP
jgi:alkylhydroperoxidase/carboxymuconolactone decarboxylase family protein YurZ